MYEGMVRNDGGIEEDFGSCTSLKLYPPIIMLVCYSVYSLELLILFIVIYFLKLFNQLYLQNNSAWKLPGPKTG